MQNNDLSVGNPLLFHRRQAANGAGPAVNRQGQASIELPCYLTLRLNPMSCLLSINSDALDEAMSEFNDGVRQLCLANIRWLEAMGCIVLHGHDDDVEPARPPRHTMS